MAKTTNILDLNNRLEKVEKENVAQNNYNSLRNRPKINGNLLTGDKTGVQLGLVDNGKLGGAIRVEKVNLSDQTTINIGFMDLQFTLPSINGYVPVSIISYNFSDRGIAQKIFISGEDITGGNTAHIYGSVTDNITLTTNTYIMILYQKEVNE